MSAGISLKALFTAEEAEAGKALIDNVANIVLTASTLSNVNEDIPIKLKDLTSSTGTMTITTENTSNLNLEVIANTGESVNISASGVGLTLATNAGLEHETGLKVKLDGTNTGLVTDVNGLKISGTVADAITLDASGTALTVSSNATISGDLTTVKGLKIPDENAIPNSIVEGMIRYHNANDQLQTYDGSAWNAIVGGGGGGLTGNFYDFSKDLKAKSELRLSDQDDLNSFNYDNADFKWKIDTYSGSAIADGSQDLSVNDEYVKFVTLDATPADSKLDLTGGAIDTPLVIEMRCSGDFELVFGLRAGLTLSDTFTTSQAHLKFSFKHNGKMSETLATANDPEIKLERHLEGTGSYTSIDLLAADNLADVFTILGYTDYAPLRHKFIIRGNLIKYYIENKEITLTSSASTFATNDLITDCYGIGFNSSHADFRLNMYQLNMYKLVGAEYLHQTKMDRDAELANSSITTLKTNVAVITDTLLVGANNTDFESDAMYVKGNMFVSGALHINTGSNVLDFQTITDGLRTDINNLTSVQVANLYNGYYSNSAMTNDVYVGNRLIVGVDKTGYTDDAMWVKGNLMVSGAIHVNTGSNILDFGATVDGIKASVDNAILTTTHMVNSLTRDNTAVFQNSNHMQISGTDKSMFIGDADGTPLYTLDMGTRIDAIRLPQGTTAQQPGNAVGLLRYNTEDSNVEVNDGSAWGAVAGGGGGVPKGYVVGAMISKGGTDTQYNITAGIVEVDGVEYVVSASSNQTITGGTGVTIPPNTTIGNKSTQGELIYLCINSTGTIKAYDSSNEPSFDGAKGGWYVTDVDSYRMIGVLYYTKALSSATIVPSFTIGRHNEITFTIDSSEGNAFVPTKLTVSNTTYTDLTTLSNYLPVSVLEYHFTIYTYGTTSVQIIPGVSSQTGGGQSTSWYRHDNRDASFNYTPIKFWMHEHTRFVKALRNPAVTCTLNNQGFKFER
jgi:hypothetical protein